MPELVELSEHGEVCVVRLRREEKLNALSAEVEGALAEALRDTRLTGSRCVVFTGSERAFSAGADVNEFADLDPAAIAAYYRATGAVYESVADLPQPTIAAISGYCLGGGLELALACDLRVADSTAVFGFPEVGLGILPSSGGTLRVVRIAGPARAKELVLLGERFGAAEARELGLVTEAVAEGEALPRALELGARLAELPDCEAGDRRDAGLVARGWPAPGALRLCAARPDRRRGGRGGALRGALRPLAQVRLHALGAAVAEGPRVPEGRAQRHVAEATAGVDHAGDRVFAGSGLSHVLRHVAELREVLLEPLDERGEVAHAVENTVAHLRRDLRLDVGRHHVRCRRQPVLTWPDGRPVDVVEPAEAINIRAGSHWASIAALCDPR
jgi:enoyl-CoA hydratase/carnithine racemase